MLTILCLKEKKGETYRSSLDSYMGCADYAISSTFLVDSSQILPPCVRRWIDSRWPSSGHFSSRQHELGDAAAIDAPSFDRVAASRRYATRTNYRFRPLKSTILLDCSTGASLDVHCATATPHETKIG